MEFYEFHINTQRIFAFTVGQWRELWLFFVGGLFPASVRMKDVHVEIGKASSNAENETQILLNLSEF